jgi:DNA (cytosine-5)-methyltransferase 1
VNAHGKFAKAKVAPSFGLDDRMTVVLFAGMGGACDGYENAGFHVNVAINHDKVAVAVHEKRHPHTRHLRCDVFEADPREVTQGRGVRALHASPDCTHFSVAKGSKPVSKRRRSLAWVICRWLGQADVEVVTLENVREIQTWGPLIAKRDPATGRVLRLDGTVAAKGERVPLREQWLVPDPKRKGRIWKAFREHISSLGFDFEYRVVNFADWGVATIRTRLLGVMVRKGQPIHWPERTHAPRKDAKRLKLKPWIGAHTIIDYSLPVRSIFGRKKDMAEASHRRIARGVVRHVVQSKRPFIMPITHSGERANHDVLDPFRTLTTAHRGELALVAAKAETVAAFLAQHNNDARREGGVHPGRDILEPAGTFTVAPQLGLVTACLDRQFGNSAGVDIGEPLPAPMCKGSGKTALVAATLGDMHGTSVAGRPMSEPLAALAAGGNHAHLILAFLQRYYGQGGQDQSLADPLTALTAKARHGLVTVTVDGVELVMTDIGTRMLEPEEGAAAHGFPKGSLPNEIIIDGKARRLTKTEKYHLVGNSVPPYPIELLARLNVRPAMAMVAAE